MSKYPMLKQFSDERAQLVNDAAAAACAVVLRRRRVLSGIRWREDLVVTAAEAIGGAEQVGVQLNGDEVDAEVVATDLGTDVAVLRVADAQEGTSATTPRPGGLPRATSPRL